DSCRTLCRCRRQDSTTCPSTSKSTTFSRSGITSPRVWIKYRFTNGNKPSSRNGWRHIVEHPKNPGHGRKSSNGSRAVFATVGKWLAWITHLHRDPKEWQRRE